MTIDISNFIISFIKNKIFSTCNCDNFALTYFDVMTLKPSMISTLSNLALNRNIPKNPYCKLVTNKNYRVQTCEIFREIEFFDHFSVRSQD